MAAFRDITDTGAAERGSGVLSMTTSKRITTAWLREQKACAHQLAIFKAEWPEGAEVTRTNLERAVALRLDLWWLADRYLTAAALAEYERVTAAARAEYERGTAAALAEYKRVRAAALAEYERVTAAARAEYERVTAPALAEYERVRAPALAEYERVTAPALAEYERVRAAALIAALCGEPAEVEA